VNNNTTILFLDPISLGICATLDSHNHNVEKKGRHANISFAPNIISSSKYLLSFFSLPKPKTNLKCIRKVNTTTLSLLTAGDPTSTRD